MEIRQLKYFLAVADKRSFVNAANALFISRQAISKAVSQLEQELDVELFMRDSNGAFLTPAGVLFYDRIRGAVAEFDQIQAEMLDYGTRYRQRIRLAFSIGTLPLYEAQLEAFCASQKNADVEYGEYLESECMEMLLACKTDMIVTTREVTDPLLTDFVIARSPAGVLLHTDHPLARLPRINGADLEGISLAAHNEWHFGKYIASLHKDYTGYDCARLLGLVLRQKCVMIVPQLLAPLHPNLRWIPLESVSFWEAHCAHFACAAGALSGTILDELRQKVLLDSSEPFKEEIYDNTK